jgi:hypothetical protein
MKNSKSLTALILVSYGLLFLPPNLNAQNNALTLNGAYIVMNGGTQTENIKLVVNQSNTLGIVRLSGGGHIQSENQYNGVKWLTNNELGNYVFPFGLGANPSGYIPFTFNKTAGNSSISMSTWGTNQQNSPKPNTSNVGPVTNMLGSTDSVLYAIDRFWDIEATATTADLTFSYLGTENTTITQSNNLLAQHWNGTSWDAQVGPGTPGITTGVGTAGPFIGQNSFSPWMLTAQCSPTNGTDIQSVCESFTWIDGNTYTANNNTATHTISGGSANGCDSIVTLNLTINTLDITTTTVAVTITANATAPAAYQWIDCNNGNSIITGETGQSFTATANGDYAVIITEGGCSDTSECVNINTVGVEAHSIQNSIAVYPNPATDKVNVEIENLDPTTQLKLIDNLGKVVYEFKPTSEISIIDLNSFSKGVYTLIISTDKNTINKKLIKQ